MTSPFAGGAVLYARNVSSVAAFYTEVAGLRVVHRESGYTVLASSGFELTIVAAPLRISESINIASPPKRREDAAAKIVLVVANLAAARAAAQEFGGELNPVEREWTFQNSRVCDGHDPEGNVVQFRECAVLTRR